MVLRPPKVKALKYLMYLAAHIVSTAFFIMVYDSSCYVLSTWHYFDAKKDTPLPPTTPPTPSSSSPVANCKKCAVFGAASIPSVLLLVDSIRGTQQFLWFIPYISTIYASLDMAALLVLKDMYVSTTIHHVTVQFLYTYLALNGFDQDGSTQPMVTFACFSCPLFLPVCRLIRRKMCLFVYVMVSPNRDGQCARYESCIDDETEIHSDSSIRLQMAQKRTCKEKRCILD